MYTQNPHNNTLILEHLEINVEISCRSHPFFSNVLEPFLPFTVFLALELKRFS